MAAELGGKQLSTLLESLPGIASVLRSPVADAIVNLVRAGAGIADFNEADAKELVQYATRRGLLGADEGAKLLEDVKEAAKASRSSKSSKKPKAAKRKTAKKAAKKSPAPKAPKAPKAASKKASSPAKKSPKKRKK